MIGSDPRYAGRLPARTPAFTIPAVASLALGIAVNTAMTGGAPFVQAFTQAIGRHAQTNTP
jgi:hypothetical protein